MALFVGGTELTGGGGGSGGGIGEVELQTFDFTTDTFDHGVANNTRKGFTTTVSNMFTTYSALRFVFHNVSTSSGAAGTAKFGLGFFLRKNGSSYPNDHDLLNHGGMMTIGRAHSNGGGSSNFNPSGAAFEMSNQFYKINHMDLVFSYDGTSKAPTAIGTFIAEMTGKTTSSAKHGTSGLIHYVGLANQTVTGSWSATADAVMFFNPQDGGGSNPFNQGTCKVYGIPV